MSVRNFYSYIFVLLLPLCFIASGQERREAGSFHNYEFPEILDTPAPEGYRPFHISHYGRHGSRYLTPSTAKNGIKAMEKAGNLTESGKRLMEAVAAVYEEQKGNEGQLSRLGMEQHRRLAERMAGRFPEVFDGERPVIKARASSFRRCFESMESFTSALQREAPGIRIDKKSGLKYFHLYSRLPLRGAKEKKAMRVLVDSMFHADFSPDRITGEYFLHRPDDPWSLCRDIFIYAADCQCIDSEINLYSFFTEEEILVLYTDMNAGIYARFFNCTEFGDKLTRAARPLLKKILEDADKALDTDSPVAANLRFGHDSGLVPLASLIGLEDYTPRMKVEKGRHEFHSWKLVPMAVNLQIVFYKSDSGPILVKFLINERETLISGLEPDSAPYYRWDEVREYLLTKSSS